MDDKFINAIIGILTGVVGLAVLATLVSKQANTAGVLQAGAQGFSQILQAATGPVSGGGLGSLPSLNSYGSSIL